MAPHESKTILADIPEAARPQDQNIPQNATRPTLPDKPPTSFTRHLQARDPQCHSPSFTSFHYAITPLGFFSLANIFKPRATHPVESLL